jgi:hypothetical protein
MCILLVEDEALIREIVTDDLDFACVCRSALPIVPIDLGGEVHRGNRSPDPSGLASIRA